MSDRVSDETLARWAPSVTACALDGPTAHEVHAIVVEVIVARALIAEAAPAIDELLDARARIAELESRLAAESIGKRGQKRVSEQRGRERDEALARLALAEEVVEAARQYRAARAQYYQAHAELRPGAEVREAQDARDDAEDAQDGALDRYDAARKETT